MELVLTIVAAWLLVSAATWFAVNSRALRRPAPPAAVPDIYPSVTMIRPVKGADVGQIDNFRAALDHGYPGEVETIFVLDDDADPGVANVRKAIAEHEAAGRAGSVRVLFSGAPPAGFTGKQHAMIVAAREARGELLAFGDSDTRPANGLLRTLVETLLHDPKIGCTFSPVVVQGNFRTSGDIGYALLLNSMYGPNAALFAGPEGRLPFIMGQIMVLRREALESVGGLECTRGHLVDDMHLGRKLHAAGWRNVMIKQKLSIMSHDWSFSEFVGVYRRWLFFSRNGLSFRFTWTQWVKYGEFFVAGIVGTLAALAGLWIPAALAAATIVLHGFANASLNRQFGGSRVPPSTAWMLWGVFLVAPLVLVSMTNNRVVWRGRSYRLGSQATLHADHAE